MLPDLYKWDHHIFISYDYGKMLLSKFWLSVGCCSRSFGSQPEYRTTLRSPHCSSKTYKGCIVSSLAVTERW